MLFERVEMKLFSELNKQFLIGLSQIFLIQMLTGGWWNRKGDVQSVYR